MALLKQGVFVVSARRTPFGANGGKLRSLTPVDLAVIVCKAALKDANVPPEAVNTVIVGNVRQISSKDCFYISRHTALRCGIPVQVPCLTVQRMCGSGFQAAINGAQEICLGEAKVALTAGSECMSGTPFVIRGSRFPLRFGEVPFVQCQQLTSLTDQYCGLMMAETAEKLAEQYNISREDCDQFALQSQKKWSHADSQGFFKDELVTVVVQEKGKTTMVDKDEHPKPGSTLEKLSRLPAVFKKDGVVTAGNASGICDGAGAILLAGEEAVKRLNMKPLARLVGYSYTGVDPSIMGIGPVPAIQKLCQKSSITLQNIDLIDVNEAFAAQFLAVQKVLNLDPEKTNVNGGAIALGHPVGATGSRIMANLIYTMRRKNAKYGIGSACIGGGQGIAVLLENVS